MRLSPLYEQHKKSQAVFFDFHGWTMPLHYGSQIDEHGEVRKGAGLFDVSHMLPIDIKGADAYALLEKLLSRNIARCHLGKGLYTLLLNERAGVIDDVIVYRLAKAHFRVVVNAGNREVCIAWFKQHAEGLHDCTVEPLLDHGILAVQGPSAIKAFSQIIPEIRYVPGLPPFYCDLYDGFREGVHEEVLVTRTGYTGESGIEVVAPAAILCGIWERLVAAGIRPIGLGARDSLRLEAGLPLYGLEMDQDTHVLNTSVRSFVDVDAGVDARHNFIGQSALLAYERLPVADKQAGVALYTKDKGIPRTGDLLVVHRRNKSDSDKVAGEATREEATREIVVGKVTSGCYSPVLGHSIAMGRVALAELEALQAGESVLFIKCHRRVLRAELTRLPFITKAK